MYHTVPSQDLLQDSSLSPEECDRFIHGLHAVPFAVDPAWDARTAALKLLDQGFHPVITYPPGPDLHGRERTGKEPMGRKWGVDPPTKPAIYGRFSDYPAAGVGLVLGPGKGPNGMALCDIEIDGDRGEASRDRLFGGHTPATAGYASRRGGHLLFAYDPARMTAVRGRVDKDEKGVIKHDTLPDLEIRIGAEQSETQSVIPPTETGGFVRRWNEHRFIAYLPEAFYAYFESFSPSPSREATDSPPMMQDTSCLTDESRANEEVQACFREIIRCQAEKVANAPPCEAHDTLLKAANVLGGYLHFGVFTRDDALDALAEAGADRQIPADEVDETIRDGIEWGEGHPLDWPRALPPLISAIGGGLNLKVKVPITTERQEVLDATLDVICNDPDLYRFGSNLVGIHEQKEDEVKLTRKTTLKGVAGSPRILLLSDAVIGCALTRTASFIKNEKKKSKKKDGETDGEKDEWIEVAVHPPDWLIKSVSTDQRYPNMRVLRGVAECPFFRPDGSLVKQPGYDAETRVFLASSDGGFLPVPESPTQDDAREAAIRLRVLTGDFPFQADDDRAAWLAGLLTPPAREAIDEPVPGLVVRGNKAGTGKGLLINLIGTIVTGRGVPISNYPDNPEEAKKLKVAIALAGPPLIHFDDLAEGSSYGNSALDSAMTSRMINDRILGSSKMTGEIPWRTCCFLSGNNITPGRTAHRRWLVCDLITELEHPEERSDMTIPDLADHVRQHRAEFLRDALTILRAHFLAGQPAGGWPKLGSFEVWDRWIRGAVWFATGLDCCSTLRKAAKESQERQQRIALLEGWLELEGGEQGITVAKAVERVIESPGKYLTLRRVLMELCTKPGQPVDPNKLGYVIRGMKSAVNDDMRFEEAGEDHRAKKWRVVVLSQRKKDELRVRKEQDALKQTVQDEEQLEYLSQTLQQTVLDGEQREYLLETPQPVDLPPE
jgi:putative DNA primase/helicase